MVEQRRRPQPPHWFGQNLYQVVAIAGNISKIAMHWLSEMRCVYREETSIDGQSSGENINPSVFYHSPDIVLTLRVE